MFALKPKYLEDPKQYCNRINSLLEQESSEWQTLWKAAIPELFSLPSNNLSVINTLLKPIESAFKSDSKFRVQAFDCWSYLLSNCPKISVATSEKLWNVFVVPLTAHNHSVYIVLSAKLRTWNSFVDASLQMNQKALRKAIPAILKFLYGPHSLDPASNFAAESESCGQLYLKLMTKCSTFVPEINTIFSYLERAIPPLSNSQNTQKFAKLIWNEALRIINESGWQPEHFNYLMRTLENLFSDNENDGFQLINNFLAILFDIHGSFPSDRLTPHMNLIVRCLFRPPVNFKVTCGILNSLLKCCENPSFCFYEIDRVLMDKVKHDRTDVDVLWTAIASCYTKCIKTNSAETEPSLNILLFPIQHISEISYETDQFNSVMKHWKLCYEGCVTSCGSQKFMPVLFEKLEACIDTSIPRLIVATYMCNAILSIAKFSDGFSHMKNVLLKIKENMPEVNNLIDSQLKSFAIKYIVTVQAFVKFEKKFWEDFSYIFKTFGPLLKNSDEGTSRADTSKSDADSDSSSKLTNEGSCNKMATPTRKRSSFLDRLLSPVVKKTDMGSPGRSNSPKVSNIDDDDVQVIEVRPKPKDSPMTQHQLEKARSKRYIPALYQDLSQSHSQSLSQTESENLFMDNKWKPSASIQPELFEENANLPSTSNTSNGTPIIPRSLSFHTGLNSPIAEKSDKVLSKVSLFNDDEKARRDSDSDSSIEVIPKNKISSDATTNDREISDKKQPTKRKNQKENETSNGATPVKRSKRLMNRVDINGDDKNDTKTRKSQVKNDKLTDNNDVLEVIDVETEPSNVVQPVDGIIDGISRASNSLMSLKEDGKSSDKRKSLRKRGNGSRYSSLIPRTRKSLLSERDKKSTDSDDSVSDRSTRDKNRIKNKLNKFRKSTDSDDSVSDRSTRDENCIKNKLNHVKMAVIDIRRSRQIEETTNANVELSASAEELSTEKKSAVVKENTSISVTSPTKSTVSDSVILVDEGVAEVISIEDSESINSMKTHEENEIASCIADPTPAPAPTSSDESTFYEGSDQNMTSKEPVVAPTDETAVEENVPVDNQSETISVPLEPAEVQKLPISPEVITSIESNAAVENHVVHECANERPVETSPIQSDPSNSAPISENSHSNIPDEPVCDVQSTSTATKENIDDNITASEELANDENKSSTETETSSYMNSNSRGAIITKRAIGPDFTMNAPKSPKLSPKNSFRIREKSLYPSPITSRSSRILFENNNQLPTTTTQRAAPMPEEMEKCNGTPRNFLRRSILKTPDSSRSPRLRVSFAEENEIKIFQPDNESDTDSLISTGDKLSNENLLNEKLQSQDMLYSPLQNCKDNIEELLGYIFSSAGSRQALDYFKSIGIEKVGQLASMSTLTASSIPAGDNRVRRMRRALKKYDEELERRHRRRPSTRRSEFKTLEISVLKDLLIEVESADTDNYGDDEINTRTDLENNEPSEETSSKEAQSTSAELPTPIEDRINPDIPAAVDDPAENHPEISDAKDTNEPVIASDNELVELKSEPVESEMPIVDMNKCAEKEIVPVENKENVDPDSGIINVDTVSESCDVIEPMETDEQPCSVPKPTNETINESADFVCTDSTTYERNINDRRSITINDIRQYTTVIDSTTNDVPMEVSLTTENPPKEAAVADETDNSTSASVSSPTENIIPQTEKISELQETVVDSQETSISEIDSVIAIPSGDRDECIIVEEQVEENVDENHVAHIEQNVENVINDCRQDEKNDDLNMEISEFTLITNNDEFITKHSQCFVEVMRQMFPILELDESRASKFAKEFFTKTNSSLEKFGFKTRFSKEK